MDALKNLTAKNSKLSGPTPSSGTSQELGKAKSIDDFFGKDGIFARLFSETIETILEAAP